jgi:phosphoglycolate phosphatase-like HAD superfamily hydrolase
VFDAVLQCPFVNGAQALFDKCAARFHLFIASGTPQGELEKIVSARDLDQYFRSIHGDSTNKADILRRICAERQFPPSDVLFVGDALGDYEGALQAGTLFVGRVQQGSRNPFPQGVHTITGLDDLEKLLPNKEVM